MVRAFAASAGYLRQNLGRVFREEDAQPPQPCISHSRPVFDRFLPLCVMFFLLIIAVGAILQFRSSRIATLEASENALFMAGELLAMKIRTSQNQGSDKLTTLFSKLPTEMQAHGREFLIIEKEGYISIASSTEKKSETHINDLFSEKISLSQLVESKSIRQIHLNTGDIASVAAFSLPAPHFNLLVIQPVKDELLNWSQDASILAVLLMCCGVGTISFSLAFCAQRTRTRVLGHHASKMQTQFETALNRGNCGLWECNLADGGIFFSKSMFRLLGLSGEETTLARIVVEERIHEEDVSPLTLIDQLLKNEAYELDHLFRMRHAENRWLWLRMRAVRLEADANGQASLVGIVMDVTNERNSELESHRADARLREAIESISEAFVLWDENNKLVMCNSKYRTFHGLSGHEKPVQGIHENMSDAHSVPNSNLLDFSNIALDKKDKIIGAPFSGSHSYEAQCRDGRWLLVNDRKTKCGGRVIIGTDITSRKRQEEALLENERQLRMTINDLGSSREALRKQAKQLTKLATLYQEQKMEVISASRLKAEFLANMNHEIRTPLNHIIGFAEMIELQVGAGKGSECYSEYARDIRLSGESLLTLIIDILDMARIEAGRVHLNRTAQKIGALLDDAALQVTKDAQAKNITLHVEPTINEDIGQRTIQIDRVFLSQALAHLLRNSIRLSPAGGHVALRARIVGEHVNIFIADSGYTVTASDLSTMACPFGHIDGMLQDGCKGSGLGTAIARSLIELHGGSLKMRALPNQGSVIMVRLPISMQSVQLFLPMTDFTPYPLH